MTCICTMQRSEWSFLGDAQSSRDAMAMCSLLRPMSTQATSWRFSAVFGGVDTMLS